MLPMLGSEKNLHISLRPITGARTISGTGSQDGDQPIVYSMATYPAREPIPHLRSGDTYRRLSNIVIRSCLKIVARTIDAQLNTIIPKNG
jgi:hypothetical protein